MAKFEKENIPATFFTTHEQLSVEQEQLWNTIPLLQQAFQNFTTNLTATNSYMQGLLTVGDFQRRVERRGIQGSFDTLQRNISQALTLTSWLDQRAQIILQADSLYVDAQEWPGNFYQWERGFLLSPADPHSRNLEKSTQSLWAVLLYAEDRQPKRLLFSPREVTAKAAGTFQFHHPSVDEPYMDEHIILTSDGFLEVYVQGGSGKKFALSRSRALETVLGTLPPRNQEETRRILHQTLRPTLLPDDCISLFTAFDHMGSALLQQKYT